MKRHGIYRKVGSTHGTDHRWNSGQVAAPPTASSYLGTLPAQDCQVRSAGSDKACPLTSPFQHLDAWCRLQKILFWTQGQVPEAQKSVFQRVSILGSLQTSVFRRVSSLGTLQTSVFQGVSSWDSLQTSVFQGVSSLGTLQTSVFQGVGTLATLQTRVFQGRGTFPDLQKTIGSRFLRLRSFG